MSAAITGAGIILLALGIWGIWFSEGAPAFIRSITEPNPRWDVLFFIAGILIVLGAGWEFGDLLVARKRLLKILDTKKRSDLMQKKDEIKECLSLLPKRYEKMVEDKEKELGIK